MKLKSRVLRKFFKNPLAIAGGIIYLGLIFTAIFASLISPYSSETQDLSNRLQSPNKTHLLGTDYLGRDIFSRIIYGSRVSLKVGISVVFISAFIGVFIGGMAGFIGGLADEITMRIIDILLAFPGILLAIALVAILGPGLNNVILALCIIGWVGYARLTRGQVLVIREMEYVISAKALGLPQIRIFFRHILPNILGPIIVEMTIGMAGAIVGEAGLSFLGLGVQPPQPSWGSILNEGRDFMREAPHITTFPGLAIMLVVLGLNFLGDGLRDALDPRLN